MPRIVSHRRLAAALVRAAALACALAVTALAPRPASAVWPSPPANEPIASVPGAQLFRSAVSDGHGGVFVAWWDGRFVVTDIYCQHVDWQGNTLWASNGQITCAAIGKQDQPLLVPDGTGGAIVTWRDFRSDTYGDLYAQHLDASGQPQWTYNGEPMCTALGEQSLPVIVSDGQGTDTTASGAFIAWEDLRETPRIYLQHVRPNGTVAWAVNGMPATVNGAPQFEPSLVGDGTGGVWMAWQQQSGTGLHIRAQHVDSTGTWLADSTGIAICTQTGNQFAPVAVTDSAGGVWVTWDDDRSGTLAVFTQRVNAAGVTMLADDGTRLCAGTGDQTAPAAAADGRGGLLAVWNDLRAGLATYGQRMDSTGALLWPATGLAISSGSGTHAFPSIAGDGSGGAFVAWEDDRSGGQDVYGQHVDSTGTPVWTVNGLAIANASGNQYQACVVSSGDSSAVVVWQDLRGGSTDIYAQRVPFGADWPRPALAEARRLSTAPNPAPGWAALAFELTQPSNAELSIYDCAGRRVRVVARAAFSAGDHRITWDGRDDDGRACPSGVYFARLTTGGRTMAARTLAVKR